MASAHPGKHKCDDFDCDNDDNDEDDDENMVKQPENWKQLLDLEPKNSGKL